MSELRALAAGLVRAEHALRARGITGGQAFQQILVALRARLGDDVEPDPAAAAAVRDLPLVAGQDLIGLAYERFFPDLFKGRRGQYFTPPPIIELLLSRLPIGPGTRVVDPTCGSAGLLVAAARRGATVHGVDIDPLVVQLARINLRLSGAEGARVQRADAFRHPVAPAEVVVANPPFSVEIRDPDVLGPLGLGERALSDHVFLAALERWVRPGGHAGLVLPWTVIANRSTAGLRDRIDAGWVRRALCLLPEGVFRPFGGAASRACLLWLQRRPAEPRPWDWAVLHDPGYDVRRAAIVPTSDAALSALLAGDGWQQVPAERWVPAPEQSGRPLSELARIRPRIRGAGPATRLDLGDTDRTTGEVVGRERLADAGTRRTLVAGDVLVSRLRPALGNVTRVPADGVARVGSGEWVALDVPRLAEFVAHALRTPAWRDALPVTGGQTRPRTAPDTVLASKVAWPGDPVAARIDAVSQRIRARRAGLREALEAIQDAVNAFASGASTAAELDARVAAIEARIGYGAATEDTGCDGSSSDSSV